MTARKHSPDGWTMTTLGEVGEYINGRGFKKSEWARKGRPIIRIQNLTGTTWETNYYAGEVDPRHVARAGDLLVSWAASLGAYIWDGPEGCVNQHIFKVDSKIDRRFHYYLLQNALADLQRQTHGSGMVHITRNRFDSTPVAIPDRNTQCRIASKIDELFSDVDAGVAALERAKANLARYRAAVLKAAVEGKLTEQWRREHPDVEPASELLKRILAQRRTKWEEEQLRTFRAKGRKPPAGWKDKYQEPPQPIGDPLQPGPPGWCWATLTQLGFLDRGKARHRPRNDPSLYGGPYPFVQTGDVGSADTFIREYSQTYNEKGLQQSRLWPAGTLCITIAANIAETAILGFDACFPDSVVGFLPASESVFVRYVELFLRTMQAHLESLAPATAQKNINLEVLHDVTVALPSKAEQDQIVNEVDAALSRGSAVATSAHRGALMAARLRQGILRQAFRGELV